MKRQPITTVRFWLEKLPAVVPIEIGNPIVSGALSLEINPASKRRGLWLGTSVRNQGRAAVELPVSPATPRLCSSPGVAVFGQEWPVSSLCGCDVFAPAGQRHSVPTSSTKIIRRRTSDLLPHENGIKKSTCPALMKCLENGRDESEDCPGKTRMQQMLGEKDFVRFDRTDLPDNGQNSSAKSRNATRSDFAIRTQESRGIFKRQRHFFYRWRVPAGKNTVDNET